MQLEGRCAWLEGSLFSFFVLIPLMLITGCTEKKTMEVNESQNGSRIEIQKGDFLVITLEGNPTTGYQWEMVPNSDGIIELQGKPEYKSGGNLAGSGGIYTFTIKLSRLVPQEWN